MSEDSVQHYKYLSNLRTNKKKRQNKGINLAPKTWQR